MVKCHPDSLIHLAESPSPSIKSIKSMSSTSVQLIHFRRSDATRRPTSETKSQKSRPFGDLPSRVMWRSGDWPTVGGGVAWVDGMDLMDGMDGD